MPDHPSFYDTIVASAEWDAWVGYQESLDAPAFDISETIECGWLSPEHWQAFLKFACMRHVYSMEVWP